MVDSQLVEYIKMGKKRGASEDALKKKLLERGHSQSAIEEAFKDAGLGNSSHLYIMLLIGFILILTLVVVAAIDYLLPDPSHFWLKIGISVSFIVILNLKKGEEVTIYPESKNKLVISI